MSTPAVPLRVLVQAREALRAASIALAANQSASKDAAVAAGMVGYYVDEALKGLEVPVAEVSHG